MAFLSATPRVASILFALVASLATADRAGAGQLRVGDVMPAFEVEDLAGASVQISPAQHPVLIVDFWSSWCLPCRGLLPEMGRLAREFAQDVSVVAVGIDADKSVGERFAASVFAGAEYQRLYDPGGSLMAEFGAPGMPTVYFVSRGVVAEIFTGFSGHELEALRPAFERLISEARPNDVADRTSAE